MKKEKKDLVINLLDSCPFPSDDDCPLRSMRQLPEKTKTAWAQGLSPEEVDEIAQYHDQCYSQRSNLENY